MSASSRRPLTNRTQRANLEWVNPYPTMSSIEAMVHVELEKRKVVFSWRYFPSRELAPTLISMLPDYAPEFTIPDLKMVITVVGNFWGTINAVVDERALAQVLLEADGWKVVNLFESEIRGGVATALDQKAPELMHPTVTGPPLPNPYGFVDLMSRLRQRLIANSFARAQNKIKVTNASRSARRRKPGPRRRRRLSRPDS